MRKVIELATVGLLIIKERKLLLAFSKNKQCFYLPGGKIDKGESPKAALCREVAEELNINISEHDLKYYIHISAPAYGEQNGVVMEQDCFFLHKNVEPVASAEIGELRYFTVADYKQQINIAPGALEVLEQLNESDLID